MKTIKLKDILSISGKGGLFKFIAQARNGIVVESMEDHKRHVAPATARVSSLEDIAIFTEEEEVPLADIFMSIHEKTEGKACISHKASGNELKDYFVELVPDYDEERVYISDIKKVFQWYNQLLAHDLLEVIDKEEESSESEESKDVATSKDKVKTKSEATSRDKVKPKDGAASKDEPKSEDGEVSK